MHINSTQLAGLVAFAPASLAAALACRSGGRSRAHATGTWAAVAAIHAVLAVEVLARTRYLVGEGVREWLQRGGFYSERRPAQASALLILAALAALVMIQLMRTAPSWPSALARAAAVIVAALFIGETVSLHAIDGILYHPAGPMLLIGWLWLACGSTTLAAAIVELRSSSR